VVSQLDVVVARGLRAGLGLQIVAPLRHVTSRIDFLGLDGRPFPTREGPLHHRDETLVRPADPWMLLQAARSRGPWSFGARLGFSMPLGRTEPDPMALGDAGRKHQHVQFGTGTWDPVVAATIARRLGTSTLAISGLGRFVTGTNEHGYRAGDRMQAGAALTRALGPWRPRLTLDVAHEGAERWNGHLGDEEGNLGRTDVLLGAGLARGPWTVAAQVPVVRRVKGAQLEYPVLLSLGWSR
jgi:hypothetical protein